ncbi:O-acetyl-ADP-ribose deacetylase [Peptostreptococcus equinus]|uniref:O-acetyl-ADP-ribose deacetylase n=1 Tax=Peptostreptococcus equinus TaxID=3003601 RepID=UPI002F2B4B66
MPFKILKTDITKLKVDAIVNAANSSLLGGGGVDGAIHRVAGPKLLEECKSLNGCQTGHAKITKAYNLPAKFVIHTVGPVYKDGNHGEKNLLESAYENSLKLAKENNLKSVAFPLISSGVYGYPQDKAIEVAINQIKKFLLNNDMNVMLILFSEELFKMSNEICKNIEY